MFSTKLSAPAALDILEYSPQLQQVPFYASWQTKYSSDAQLEHHCDCFFKFTGDSLLVDLPR